MTNISDDQLRKVVISKSNAEVESANVDSGDEEEGEAIESIEVQEIKEAVFLLFQNFRECKTTTQDKQDKILNTKCKEINDKSTEIYSNFDYSIRISKKLRSHSIDILNSSDTDTRNSVDNIDTKNNLIDKRNNEIIEHKEKKEIHESISPRLKILGSIFIVLAFLILFFLYPNPNDSIREDVLLFAKGFFLISVGFGFSLSSSHHESKVTETEEDLEQIKKFLEESNKDDVEKVEEKLSNLIKQLGIMYKYWKKNQKNLKELISEPNPQLSKEKWEFIKQQCETYVQDVEQMMNKNNRLREIDSSNESESSGSRNDENNTEDCLRTIAKKAKVRISSRFRLPVDKLDMNKRMIHRRLANSCEAFSPNWTVESNVICVVGDAELPSDQYWVKIEYVGIALSDSINPFYRNSKYGIASIPATPQK
ncbi:2014_t:CDS:2 [Diversispora eburnea]|uniref:2014_t:CDS:1 n=1 Tax=Diversispora eburnea TaxID=1213867 RepID=A0A9N9B5G7_9GLOM|nr:2014_t:CDS:2 [Diversispora eburnea]